MTRAFVLGNGPSLRGFDYDSLMGEFTVACNRIHLVYPKFKWRPTAYVCSDLSDNSFNYVADIFFHADQGYPVYLADHVMHGAFNPYTYRDAVAAVRNRPWYNEKNLRPFITCGDMDSVSSPAPDEWHMPYLCSYGGSVPTAIQVAYLHGATEIQVLGADYSYRPNAQNWMVDDYLPLDTYQTQHYVDKKNRLGELALALAAAECEKRSIAFKRGF